MHSKEAIIDQVARVAVALAEKPTSTQKLLAYIIEHAHDRVFSTHKGRHALMLSRLGMSRSTYQFAIARLTQLRILKKLSNANGGSYVFYELSSAIPPIEVANHLISPFIAYYKR